MSDVIVIGVAGGTGSGKTTLVKALINRFGDNISVLSHDNYYKRHDEMSYEEMLHQLAQRSDENIKLATYTKVIGKVITDREVMDKDEFGYL